MVGADARNTFRVYEGPEASKGSEAALDHDETERFVSEAPYVRSLTSEFTAIRRGRVNQADFQIPAEFTVREALACPPVTPSADSMLIDRLCGGGRLDR